MMNLLTEFYLCVTTNMVLTYGMGLSVTANAERMGIRRVLSCLLTAGFCAFSACAAFWAEPYVYALSKFVRPLIYIAASGLLYAVLLGMAKILPERYRKPMTDALHPGAFSGAVMGVSLLTNETAGTILNAVQFGLRSGVGVLLVGMMLEAAAPKLSSKDCPSAVRGWPAMLIYIGILSCAVFCMTQTNG